jgi:hypothetical protein
MENYTRVMKAIIKAQIEDMEFEERVDWYEIIIKTFEIEGWSEATHVLGCDGAYDEAMVQVHPEIFEDTIDLSVCPCGCNGDLLEIDITLAVYRPAECITLNYTIESLV